MKSWRSHPGKSNPAYTHGHTIGKFSPTYHSWVAMKTRCNNPKRKSYARYGGRGIRMCKRWERFENFLNDMGIRPANKTLDRINNNLGYSKFNCRWADGKTQARETAKIRTRHLKIIREACVTPNTVPNLVRILNLHIETIRHMVRQLKNTGKIRIVGHNKNYKAKTPLLKSTGSYYAIRK